MENYKNKLINCLYMLLLFPTYNYGMKWNIPHIPGVGIIGDTIRRMPNRLEFLELSKQAFGALPLEAASIAFNNICATNKNSNSQHMPNIDEMNLQLRTACNKYSFPLTKLDDLLHHPEFDPMKKVAILATGWTTQVNETETIDIIAKAYACRQDWNFLAVDSANFVDTFYTWSAFNTEQIGEYVSKGLIQLAEVIPVENIHLIGHSLGAHIAAAAARYFRDATNKLIPRVTALDPAKPCFNEGQALTGLSRGDAEFIDVIHSNPGILGKRESIGDIDFYTNGFKPLSPGCLTITCAHARSWFFYAESVYPGNENNFLAKRCTSLSNLKAGNCPGAYVPMGFATPTNVKGNYFLEVNAIPPFGFGGSKALAKEQRNCGLCL